MQHFYVLLSQLLGVMMCSLLTGRAGREIRLWRAGKPAHEIQQALFNNPLYARTGRLT